MGTVVCIDYMLRLERTSIRSSVKQSCKGRSHVHLQTPQTSFRVCLKALKVDGPVSGCTDLVELELDGHKCLVGRHESALHARCDVPLAEPECDVQEIQRQGCT